jgi:hypothetical protein
MRENQLPTYDMSVNTTGCCPRFNPEGWDEQELHFHDKRFLRAETRALAHVPIDMGKVFSRVNTHMQEAGAFDPEDFIVLSRDLSPWAGEHYFSVAEPVPGEEMASLSGDFITKVFEGPYREARHWHDQMAELARARGAEPGRIFFFYTTCPKCAKAYGQNYVVGVAELLPRAG